MTSSRYSHSVLELNRDQKTIRDMTIPQLKDLLKALTQRVSGKKEELVKRVVEAYNDLIAQAQSGRITKAYLDSRVDFVQHCASQKFVLRLSKMSKT